MKKIILILLCLTYIIVFFGCTKSNDYKDASYTYNNYSENENYIEDDYKNNHQSTYNPVGNETLQFPSQNDIFTYDVYETYVEITGVSAEEIDDELIIPDELDNLPVRSIGERAFGAEQSRFSTSGWTITSVVIPKTVYNIDNSAFYKCELLSSVDLSDGLISIGSSAFASTAITSINIPDTVTELGSRVFMGCDNLQSVHLGDGITVIPDEMFATCYNLNQITWGKSVNAIGISAFSHTGFDKIVLPDTIKEIYSSAFSYMENLTEFIFSDSVNMVDTFVLSDCPNLAKVQIGKNITSLPEYLFNNCDNLQTIIIPANVVNINSGVFGKDEDFGLASKVKPMIYGEKGSEAASFASEKGLIFKAV